MNIVFLFLGGGLGAVSRYIIFLLLQSFEHQHIRLGVFTVNILGSFCIGIALGLFLKNGILPRGSASHLRAGQPRIPSPRKKHNGIFY